MIAANLKRSDYALWVKVSDLATELQQLPLAAQCLSKVKVIYIIKIMKLSLRWLIWISGIEVRFSELVSALEKGKHISGATELEESNW